MKYWLYLLAAGLFEVVFAFSLKQSNHFKNMIWSAVFLFSVAISLYLLSKAIEGIAVGTAYAVWTGIGASGTIVLGILFFKESIDFWRLFFLIILIVSIIGIKFSSKT